MNNRQYQRTYLSLFISTFFLPFTTHAESMTPTLLTNDINSAKNFYFSSARAISGDGNVIGGIGEGSHERAGAAVIWQNGTIKEFMNFGRAYYDETKVHPTSYKANNAAIWAVSHDGSTYAGEALYSYRGKAGFTTRDFKARFPAIWLADNDKPIRLATIRQGGLGTIGNRAGDNTTVSGKVNALSANGSIAIGQSIPEKDSYNESSTTLAVLWKRGENGWITGTKPEILPTPYEKSDYYAPSANANAINHAGNVIAGSADWIKAVNKNTSFSKDQRPTIWTSENLSDWKVTRLPVEEHDNFNGMAHAISADGITVAGYTQTTTDVKRNQAVVWKNNGQDKSVSENWTFTYLKSLTHHRAEEHDAGSSFAYSLNKDGSIVGGIATTEQDCATTEKPDDNCIARPVVWYNTTSKPLELNTLKADGSGNGAVYALNDDGTIAVGVADTDLTDGYARTQKAVVWKITYPKTPLPEAPTSPKPTQPDTPKLNTLPSTPEQAPITYTVSSVETPTSSVPGYSFAMTISGDGRVIGGIGESRTERGGAATIWKEGQTIALRNFEGKTNHAAVWAISYDGLTYGGEARGHYFRKADNRKVISKYPAIWQNGHDHPTRLDTLGLNGMGAVNNLIDNPTQVSGKVSALSADGAFAVGQSIAPIDYTFDPRAKQAVLWKREGTQWQEGSKPIRLETPFSNSTYYTPSADARTISHDGQVIAGSADFIGKRLERQSIKNQRPAIWTDDGSEDWKVTRLNVDTPHNFNGAVHALNADGSVAIGYTQVSPNVKQNQAVLWKNNGQDKGRSENWHYTYLKSLTNYTSDQHDAGSSFAYALNAQGNIIGGTAAIDQGCATTDRPDDNCVSRPVIWYDSAQKPVALSTLKMEGIGEGAIYGLNHDGTIAVGVSETDLTDDFNRPIQKATVWKLDYTQAIPKVSDPVSIQDTRETMGQLGTRALETISSQNRLLSSLTESFSGFDAIDSNAYALADYSRIDFRNTFVEAKSTLPSHLNRQTQPSKLYAAGQAGRIFVRTKATVDAEKQDRSLLTQLNIGYVMNENFALGTALFHTPYSKQVNGYKRTSDNLGIGLYAQWKQAVENGHWYLRATGAVNRYQVEIERQAIEGTEQAKGKTNVSSQSVALLAGANAHILSGGHAGLYTGLKYTEVKQHGYQEESVAFPVSYAPLKFRHTAAMLGITTSIPLTNQLFWEPKAEIEYALSLKNPHYHAKADGIGDVKMQGDFKRLHGDISSTLRYNINAKSSIDLTPYVGRGLSGNAYWGGSVGLNVTF